MLSFDQGFFPNKNHVFFTVDHVKIIELHIIHT